MDAKELVKECETTLKVGWNPYKYIKLAWCSFNGDFNYFKKIIVDNIGDTDLEKFIEICDNRIARAEAFLQDISTVLGFFVTSLTIVLAVSTMEQGKTPMDPVLDSIVTSSNYEYFIPVLIISLLAGIIILSILLAHYRAHIHAWTAFKEGAVLSKSS